jgi:hypothetical protein
LSRFLAHKRLLAIGSRTSRAAAFSIGATPKLCAHLLLATRIVFGNVTFAITGDAMPQTRFLAAIINLFTGFRLFAISVCGGSTCTLQQGALPHALTSLGALAIRI